MSLFVSALNNVDLPTFGKPTIPIDKLMRDIITEVSHDYQKILQFDSEWVVANHKHLYYNHRYGEKNIELFFYSE